MQASLPNSQSSLSKSKYIKPIVLGAFILSVLVLLGLIMAMLLTDENEKSSNDYVDSTPTSMSINNYPTDVCPDEIIYGQGLPIGVWDGVQHQVTDDEGINWLDSVCKPLIQTQGSSNQLQKAPWQYINDAWVYTKGTEPTCPEQILQISPVNVSLATAILYPGQTRGQYKPHGGFRFDNSTNSAISVTLPITARLVGGAKYLESGEVQYLLEFVSDCGIALRFDHLYTLAGEFKTIGDSLPQNPEGDSRGTFLEGKEFAAGSLVATAVGIPSMNNTGVDFGVYDYRQRNQASQDPNYVSQYASYSSSQAFYAVCWLDLLPNGDAAIAKALPGGDGKSGKYSDYCK